MPTKLQNKLCIKFKGDHIYLLCGTVSGKLSRAKNCNQLKSDVNPGL